MRVVVLFQQEIISACIALFLVSCDLSRIPDEIPPEPPDLDIIPKTTPVPPLDYCIRSGENLVVTVKNIGLGSSDVSTTAVDFFTRLTTGDLLLLETVKKSTPELNSGETVQLLFKIPSNCFDPDCEFSIKVDVLNDVSESDETNNIAVDTCED